MNGLLLGTFALQALIAGDRRLLDWLASREDDDVYVTTVSVGVLLAMAEDLATPQRRIWSDKLRRDVPVQFGARLRGYDMRAAEAWSGLFGAVPEDADVQEGELYVIAIAVAEGLAYVAPELPWHAGLAGLARQDPWA